MIITLAANWHLGGNPPTDIPFLHHFLQVHIYTPGKWTDLIHGAWGGGCIKGSLTLSLADCQKAGGQYK